MARLLLALVFCLGAVLLGFTGSTKGGILTMVSWDTCFVRMWTDLPEEAKIVFIGSSRMRRGLQVDVISDTLGMPETGVINLGHPSPSMPLDLSIMDRLSAAHPLKVIVFEVLPRSPALRGLERSIDPGNTPVDPPLSFGVVNARYLLGADLSSIAQLILDHTDNRLLAYWQVARMWSARISYTIPKVPEVVWIQASSWIRPLLDPNYKGIFDPNRLQDCMNLAWTDRSDQAQNGTRKGRKLKADYRAAFDGWEDPDPLGFFDAEATFLDRAMINKMTRLARERSSIPIFFYLPGIAVPVDPDLTKTFEATYGVPLWIPPPELRTELENGGFYDNSHLNNRGRDLLSIWLAAQLSKVSLDH